jgi:hypothetical protein
MPSTSIITLEPAGSSAELQYRASSEEMGGVTGTSYSPTNGLSLGVTKIGLFTAVPVVQPTHIDDANAGDIVSKFNTLLAKLEDLGILGI